VLLLAYLYIEMTTDERAMGTFILPLAVALQSIPAFKPALEDRAAVLQGPLFSVHVLSLLFAYASFALACVIGITYVLLFKEIKAKHLGFFYARLPSLQVLDSMNHERSSSAGSFSPSACSSAGFTRRRASTTRAGDVVAIPKFWRSSVGPYSFEAFAARRMDGVTPFRVFVGVGICDCFEFHADQLLFNDCRTRADRNWRCSQSSQAKLTLRPRARRLISETFLCILWSE
jgi:hypothetical protein